MHIHDIIKIMYVNIGFLPDYPYHLISDDEMFDAFLKEGGFFATYYPCPGREFEKAYDELFNYIEDSILAYKEDNTNAIPDWVYSYMIMRPITYQSSIEDIDYLCEMCNISFSNGLPVFNEDVARVCYDISVKWLQKTPSKANNRPPTMFGETHVTKSLRLIQANILLDSDFEVKI